MDADLRSLLADHLRRHALRTGGAYTLRSGEATDWYLDARQTTFAGPGAVVVADAVLAVLDPDAVALGGMTMGADPIAVSAALRAATQGRLLAAFSVRKQAKGHGVGGRVVGPVHPGDAVCVVEDTTTTGGALVEAIEVVTGHGLDVVQALALVDRSRGVVSERMAERGIPYVALLLPADLGVEG